mgnify:FL=1
MLASVVLTLGMTPPPQYHHGIRGIVSVSGDASIVSENEGLDVFYKTNKDPEDRGSRGRGKLRLVARD